jgi:hypothetical protein
MAIDHDAKAIADAFRQIAVGVLQINDVLGRNGQLNASIPTNWPLGKSFDEFAAGCKAMVEHYDALACREGRPWEQADGNNFPGK